MSAVDPITAQARALSLLTLDEAASFLRLTRRTFARRVQPYLQVVKFTPSKVYVHKEELELWGRTPEVLPEVFELTEDEGVYFIQDGDRGAIKIGCSANMRQRVKALRNNSPVPLRFLGAVDRGSNPRSSVWYFNLEKRLHAELQAFRIHGEWFRNSVRVRGAVLRSLQR